MQETLPGTLVTFDCSLVQMKAKHDLGSRQREMENAAALLKLEVEDEIRMEFNSSSPSSPEPLEDLEASFEVQGSLQCEADLEATSLFADRRLLSLEEKLRFSKVLLMVRTLKSCCCSCSGQALGAGACSSNTQC